MNILPFIPQGWITGIGVAIKLLSALLAVLTAIQGGDLATILQHLSLALGAYATGAGVVAVGLRRAIGRVMGEVTFTPGQAAPPAAASSSSTPALVLLVLVGAGGALAGLGCYPQINGPAFSLNTVVQAAPAPGSSPAAAGVRASAAVPPS